MKNLKNIYIIGALLLVATFFSQCKDPDYAERVNYEILIGEYLESNPDQFSMFTDVLNSSKTMAFLKAYGTYTCFAPNNNAMQNYLNKYGYGSVSQIPDEEKKNLVRFCVVRDTIASELFVDGPLPKESLYGQYLTTGTYFEDGVSVTKVNKYASIEELDIRAQNGLVHVVSTVLEPEKKSIAQYLESLDNYKIFTQGLKETGFYEVLDSVPNASNPDTTWYTVFAISDEVYAKDSINSFDDLNDRYGSKNNAESDSLSLYMAYHILGDQMRFMTDLISAKAIETMAPTEVLTFKAKADTILINDDYFAGNYEPGYRINREESDLTVGSGVIHFVESNFAIKVRYPFAVYWEVSDQLGIRKVPGVYQKKTLPGIVNGQLEDITWYPEDKTITYNYGLDYYHNIFNDCLYFDFRIGIITAIYIKTPILVKGKYKMYICSRNIPTQARMALFYAYWNGESTNKVLDLKKAPGLTDGVAPTDGELELAGMRIYQYQPEYWQAADSASLANLIAKGKKQNWQATVAYGRWCGQYAGTVEVESTGRQDLRFEVISGGNGSFFYLDEIQWIPVEEDQNWPRVNCLDGSLVYKEDLEAGILPPAN